jgi:hypothetical protein
MTFKLLGTCAAVALLATSAFSADLARNKSLDKMMYTINPEVSVSGPVFSDQSDSAAKSKYGTELVRLILKEAHAQAVKYLEAGDTQAYYAVLTMALTVPMQEGLYIQYRSVEGDVCRSDANSGELVRKSGETNYNLFNQYFKSATPFFPNCEDINTDKVTQIIRGGDGTDLSIMQVSIRWHFDDFLANKKYESVRSTLEYGIAHLMKGFTPVYRNVGDYKCISEGGGFFRKKKVSYINLIRGTWAGQYNSGSITQTCRFADSGSKFKGHDKGFERNLNTILDFNGTLSVDMVGDLKLDSDVAAAFKEVVTNLKENKNERTALDKILN